MDGWVDGWNKEKGRLDGWMIGRMIACRQG